MDQTRKSVKPKPVAGNYLSCRKSFWVKSIEVQSEIPIRSECSSCGVNKSSWLQVYCKNKNFRVFLGLVLDLFSVNSRNFYENVPVADPGFLRRAATLDGVPTYYLTNFLLKPNSVSNFQFAHFFSNLGVTHTHKFYNCDVKVSQAEIHCWTYYERMLKSIEIITVLFQLVFTNT